jgi:hypothetical protein
MGAQLPLYLFSRGRDTSFIGSHISLQNYGNKQKIEI